MRSAMKADAIRSAAQGGMKETPGGRPADTAEETAARPRLTLRHLHSLIEALREEHLNLEKRVDRLSDLVERMAAPDAGDRRESALVGNRIGESRLAALPEWPAGREEAGGRAAAHPAAAEDRAAFGFAIWAGVERAIGNAAVMLAAGREAEPEDADRPAERAEAKAEAAALFRRQRPPEHEQRDVPIESLLLELREAARIADEIAANAAAEYRADPAHPPRAPDMSGGEAPGRPAAQGVPAAAAPEPGTPGTAAAGPQAREAGAAAPQPAAVETPESGAEPAAAAVPPDAPAAGAPAQTERRQPASDMPSITIPRSERHRVRKKPSLWARLFGRQHA